MQLNIQVHGIVQNRNGKTMATLFGKWDESMHYLHGDPSAKGKGAETPSSQPRLLWKRSKPPKNPTRYNLTRFAITLNELTPGLKVSINELFSVKKISLSIKDQSCAIYCFDDNN